MRGNTFLLSLLATASAAPATPAMAQEVDPGTFASARDGSLLVASSALLDGRFADMRGFWTDDGVPCSTSRRLTVSVRINREADGNSRVVRRRKTGMVRNCAEGGPNFGFTIRAAKVGLACPDGSWRPGRYDLSTTTIYRSTGLTASASLFFTIERAC